jgi:hypothetical protein
MNYGSCLSSSLVSIVRTIGSRRLQWAGYLATAFVWGNVAPVFLTIVASKQFLCLLALILIKTQLTLANIKVLGLKNRINLYVVGSTLLYDVIF